MASGGGGSRRRSVFFPPLFFLLFFLLCFSFSLFFLNFSLLFFCSFSSFFSYFSPLFFFLSLSFLIFLLFFLFSFFQSPVSFLPCIYRQNKGEKETYYPCPVNGTGVGWSGWPFCNHPRDTSPPFSPTRGKLWASRGPWSTSF